jgi:hypothetical protein
MRAPSYHYFGGLLGLTLQTHTNAFIIPNHSAKIANNIISSSISLSMARRGLETLEEGATPLRESIMTNADHETLMHLPHLIFS